LKSALDQILETGCLIKDLDVGLLDFPSVIDNEEVYFVLEVGRRPDSFLPSAERGIFR